MVDKSPWREIPIGRVVVYAIVLLSLRSACTFLQANPQYLPSEPVMNMISADKMFSLVKKPKSFLHVGQTEDDVREMLGSPSGMMTITNRTILMYNGSLLEFVDGLLVTSDTNLLAEIKKVRRHSSESTSGKGKEQGTFFDSFKSKTDSSR